MTLNFTVLGTPQPQGSAKAFIPKGWKRAVITTDNAKLKPWRQDVAFQAADSMRRRGCVASACEAVEIRATFFFARPKSAPKRIVQKTTRPDVDKLARGLLDALTGIVYADDSQVVSISCRKEFGAPERVEIGITAIPVKSEAVA